MSKLNEAVLRLWDAGLDTDRIARVLKEKQSLIERELHIGLEARRKATLSEKKAR